MSKELTPRQMKDLGQIEDCSDSVEIKGNIDYPTLLTEKRLLNLTYDLGMLREIAKSLNVKVDVPTDFKKDLIKPPCKRDGN